MVYRTQNSNCTFTSTKVYGQTERYDLFEDLFHSLAHVRLLNNWFQEKYMYKYEKEFFPDSSVYYSLKDNIWNNWTDIQTSPSLSKNYNTEKRKYVLFLKQQMKIDLQSHYWQYHHLHQHLLLMHPHQMKQ